MSSRSFFWRMVYLVLEGHVELLAIVVDGVVEVKFICKHICCRLEQEVVLIYGWYIRCLLMLLYNLNIMLIVLLFTNK